MGLEMSSPHSSHSTADETQCEEPRYLQGKREDKGGQEPFLLTITWGLKVSFTSTDKAKNKTDPYTGVGH